MAGRKPPQPEVAGIRAITNEGRGVADLPGKVVFVDGALPGETVRLQRVRRRRQFDEARLDEVLCPSADRVAPRCAVYEYCGGCSLQHLDARRQVQLKQDALLETLERRGGLRPARVLEPLVGPVWGYRRRARLGARYVAGKERVLVGFRERYKPFITDTDRCEVLAEPVGSLLGALAELLSGLTIRAQVPQIEVAVADNLTALVLRVLQPPSDGDRDSLQSFAAEHGICFFLQSGGRDSLEPLPGAGGALPEPLWYELPAFDVRLTFGPLDFVQVNGALNRSLVSRAVDLLDPRPGDDVLDLFCGIGNFSLPLARRAGQVLGIEGSAELVARARANASANGLGNARFLHGDLADPEPADAWQRESWDRVLLDPARAGADAVVRILAAMPPERIVYVSCHPDTLARDAATLVAAGGLELSAAGVLDMFPHTSHMESIAVFDRKC